MRISSRRGAVALSALALLAYSPLAAPQARADILTDANAADAGNFAALFEGGGSGNTLNTNNTSINGQIGIGGAGKFAASGPGTISSTGATNIQVASAVNSGQVTSSNTTYVQNAGPGQTTSSTPVTVFGASNVTTDLTNLNSFSSTVGGFTGTSLTVNLNNNQSQTINASGGPAGTNGTITGNESVFTVSSFNFTNGATLTINGDGVHNVILNFSRAASFGGTILLTGGLTSDQVLFNFTGGSNLSGGPALTVSTNGATETGIFLDPNGAMQINQSVLNGRFFGGDSTNMQIVSGVTLNAPGGGTSPDVASVPEPSSMAMVLGIGGLTALGYTWRRRRSK